MQGPVYAQLAPVRRRQQCLRVLKAAALGLLVGAVVAVVLGAGRWLGGWAVGPVVGGAVVAAGFLLGALAGLFWRRNWRGAAAAVDAHYKLKDRAATALAFVGRPEPTV